MKMKLLSRVWFLATPWTAAYQAPSSMGFSRQEYWSGVPLPSPFPPPAPSKCWSAAFVVLSFPESHIRGITRYTAFLVCFFFTLHSALKVFLMFQDQQVCSFSLPRSIPSCGYINMRLFPVWRVAWPELQWHCVQTLVWECNMEQVTLGNTYTALRFPVIPILTNT